MKIHYHINDFNSKGTVVTLGTFDGVHLGHKQVIGQIKRLAHEQQLESLIFTFFPHPRQVVSQSDESLRLINTLEEKKHLLSKTGIDHLVVYPFTPEFAKLSYEDFVREILVGQLNMKVLVVGHDHRLGKNREGGYDNLVRLSLRLGFEVRKIEAFVIQHTDISSSKIRNALNEGDIELANRFLGYPYFLQGIVVPGNQLGRTLGFPTANIASPDRYKLIPAEGVYAVRVKAGKHRYPGMLNIGYRPTVNQNPDHRTIEVHIIGFEGSLYHQPITICFHKKIREEMKFNSLGELTEQLHRDRQMVESYLSDMASCSETFTG